MGGGEGVRRGGDTIVVEVLEMGLWKWCPRSRSV